MAIDATVGGVSSNSFVTRAEADSYFLARANTTWAALTADNKDAALVKATSHIEATYETSFKGARASTTQALSWPREGVVVDSVEILPTVLPPRLKNAQMELAVKASASDLLVDETQTVRREKVDVLEVEYAGGSTATVMYAFVQRLLAPLLRGGVSSGSFSQSLLERA